VFIEAKDDGGDGDNWTTGNIFWQIASLPQHISFFAFFWSLRMHHHRCWSAGVFCAKVVPFGG